MPLFEFKNRKATKINQKEFKNELELHELIDNNLEELFGVRYIKDEHVTDKHGRIETLGIDESNRPVVIEYKKSKEKGQLTQANRYITWVKQNPDSFELLVRDNIGKIKGNIDFVNTRIICFAQEYNIDDKCLALSLGAELWKYRFYDNNILVITREEEPEQLITTKNKQVTIKKIKKEPLKAKTVDQHLTGTSKELTDIFNSIDSQIMDISGEIDRYTTNTEISYKTSRGFAYLQIQKKSDRLKLFLRTNNDIISDPKNLTARIPKTHGWGNITRQLFVSPSDIKSYNYTVKDILDLIYQSYQTTQ